MARLSRGSMVQCSNGCGTEVEYLCGPKSITCKDCRIAKARACRKANRNAANAKAVKAESYSGKGGSRVRPLHVRGLIGSDAWYDSCGEAYVSRVLKAHRRSKKRYANQVGGLK